MTDRLAIQNERLKEITEILRKLESKSYELNYDLQKSEYSKDLSGPQNLNGTSIKRIKKQVKTMFDGLTELIDKIESS